MTLNKSIKYIPKHTSANTQYIEIDRDEMEWLKLELARYLSVFGELESSNNSDVQKILKSWWHKKDKKLPRGQNGINSPLTFVSGLYNNLTYNGQRDLSEKVLPAIEQISTNAYMLEEALEELTRTPNYNKTSITFLLSINQYVL